MVMIEAMTRNVENDRNPSSLTESRRCVFAMHRTWNAVEWMDGWVDGWMDGWIDGWITLGQQRNL